MDNIEEYLSQFEDFELAFFWKYKLDTYMEGTQNEIKAYLGKRNLDETKMQNLIEEYSHKTFTDHELRCSRCKSKKIITKEENPSETYFDPEILKIASSTYNDINGRKMDYACVVCGLALNPFKHSSFTRKILNAVLNILSLPINNARRGHW
ncbi:MAG: hypothetical protein EPN39_09495 [Chitinophagaceae bacterium]|nr:MAG: hypothetical protein EPN39_09495 [Chitinophagaceae bacterium]